MDQQKYERMVKALEVDATINPKSFHTKVLLLSSLGYVVLFGTLALLALLTYWIITNISSRNLMTMIKVGGFALLILLPLVWVVLKVFFTRIPAPEGRRLTRKEAPRLFGALDRIRKDLNGPPIHHVLIDDEFNAAIMQRPRFGLFGGHTNYLILGLPFMLGVSPKEMLAVVAHEYGHLGGNHGKVSAWIYRQRRTFGAVYDEINDGDDENWVHGMLMGMLNKYMPYYNAHTFVMSRQNEYEADQAACKVVGAKSAATGLIRTSLLIPWVQDEFWPKIYVQADTSDRPAFKPYSAMRTAFKASYAQWATKTNLAEAMARKSDLHDTHPALRERVEATGEIAAVPACVDVAAAEALLGPTAKSLIDEFDLQWWEKKRKDWNARFQYVYRSKARLKEFAAMSLGTLKLGELQEYSVLSSEFEPPAKAKVVLEYFLSHGDGPYPRAEFEYGRILLAEDNEKGLMHLEKAAKTDGDLLWQAARCGYGWLMQKYGEKRAEEWWGRVVPGED